MHCIKIDRFWIKLFLLIAVCGCVVGGVISLVYKNYISAFILFCTMILCAIYLYTWIKTKPAGHNTHSTIELPKKDNFINIIS